MLSAYSKLFPKIYQCRALLFFCNQASTNGEKELTQILKRKFPQAVYVKVEDISGGCGSMYQIEIEAQEFQGKRTVQQHRMVNEALKNEIKDMHGLRILTATPKTPA